MEEQQLRFHHRHLPTFTKGIKFLGWKLTHLYLPFVIHILTDKYKDRFHHFIIDTFYACVTFVFIATNIGLGIWFYRYFTVPDLSVRVVTQQEITSGKPTHVVILYQNKNRPITNAALDVYLPHGFIVNAQKERTMHEPFHVEIGNLAKDDVGMIDIEGVWFGDVEESATVRAVTSYMYYHRTENAVSTQTLTISHSAIIASMRFKKAATYGVPVESEISYKNESDFAQKDVEFVLQLPEKFSVKSVKQGDTQLAYNEEKQSLTLSRVQAHEEGKIKIRGVFTSATSGSNAISGDQEVIISGMYSSQLADAPVFEERIQHGSFFSGVRVVHPRLFVSMSGNTAVHFGETITATVTVKNTGDVPAQNIRLRGQLSGIPVMPSGTTVSVVDERKTLRTQGGVGSTVSFPVIAEIPAGQSRTYTVRIPTRATNSQRVSSSFRVNGTGYSPDVDTTIPMRSVSFDTKYHSQLQVSATPLYYGPNGEEIGYGPYPPKAWETTAMRVVLRVNNINNTLSGIRVHTTLLPQIKWTGSYSVSAGTNLSWNPTSRTIDWNISSLAPQAQGYGAQFEVRFTPNHLQVGKKLPFTDVITLSPKDTYTGETLFQSIPAVVLPVAIVP